MGLSTRRNTDNANSDRLMVGMNMKVMDPVDQSRCLIESIKSSTRELSIRLEAIIFAK